MEKTIVFKSGRELPVPEKVISFIIDKFGNGFEEENILFHFHDKGKYICSINVCDISFIA